MTEGLVDHLFMNFSVRIMDDGKVSLYAIE